MSGPDLTGVPDPPDALLDGIDGEQRDAVKRIWQHGWAACREMVIAQTGPQDPISELLANTVSQHELFSSYQQAGFSAQQALHLLSVSILGAMLAP
jgi:hypothetical protein